MIAYRGTSGGMYKTDPSNYLCMLHPRIDGVICVSIPVILSKKILNLILLFNMVHTFSARLYGTIESKRLKNKWSFMDMKNLKKVTITLCSLIAFISPLADADVTTSNTFRIECESINYNEEVCQLPNIGIIDVNIRKLTQIGLVGKTYRGLTLQVQSMLIKDVGQNLR
ncbi:MAG: hypothetical protein ACJAVA_002739 [Flavobacteriaceae bacterium]|jgi:hypothetical protein